MSILIQKNQKLSLHINKSKFLKIIPALLFFVISSFSHVAAQQKVIYGNVHAFKDLPLKNIQVTAAKAKTTVQTDSLGRFRINCEPNDKLELTGNGFQKKVLKLEKEENKIIQIKMIFKGGEKNMKLAVENDHVNKEDLENSISLYPDQNYEYFNYADIFSAISKIYAGNDNIKVRGNEVYVRKEKSTFSAAPAIFIVNGKLALEIKDILPGDIESIEIIPDGSKQYGPGAANGVVFIKTTN